jgi:prevent-host-death family protein
MQTIGAFEAKTHFSALLLQVEKGEQVVITKHGHPVAKLIPILGEDREAVRQTIQQLKRFVQSNTLGGLDWKSLRDEGRR